MPNFRAIFRVLGIFSFVLCLILFIPCGVSAYFEYIVDVRLHPQPHVTEAFLKTISFCGLLSLLFYGIGHSSYKSIDTREAILTVVLVWLYVSFISALPFWISGTLCNPIDALFEVVSGLTTTGSTICHPKNIDPATHLESEYQVTLNGFQAIHYSFHGTIQPVFDRWNQQILIGVEAVPKALLFWRSFLQWLGGVGIVILFVAILPLLGLRGKTLFSYESTGPILSNLKPHIKETAKILWITYSVLTALCALLLWATNVKMTCLDAVTTAFSTLSTGGFSIRNTSIAYYDSWITEAIVVVFMTIGGLNLSLFYLILRKGYNKILDTELIVYVGLLATACCYGVSTLINQPIYPLETNLSPQEGYSSLSAIRYGIFQFVSSMTSTGFATANFDQWPFATQMALVIVMYFGGMAGSTTGGVKVIRLCILYQSWRKSIEMFLRRDIVQVLRVGERIISDRTAFLVLCFLFIPVVMSIIATTLFVLDGVDLETAFGLTTCFLNNTGFSFRMAGPLVSCAFLSNFSKILAAFWMLIGRLEYLVVLVLFIPSFWRNR